MSFAQATTTYLAANLLILMALFQVVTFDFLFERSGRALSYRARLNLHYFALTSVLCLALFHPFLPKREIFQPMAKVWAAPSGKVFLQDSTARETQGYLDGLATKEMLSVDTASRNFLFVAFLLVAAGLIRLGLDLARLHRIRAHSVLVRRIKSLRIYVSEEVHVPFSFWLPGQKNVVVPEALIGRPGYRIAVLHELHHHRHGDTQWVYVIWFLRILFFPNPVIHLWNRWVSEIQEFACDEALVGQRKVESRAYASCLIEVAQSAVRRERSPVCATGLTFLVDRNTLKRRIEKMVEKKENKLGWKATLPIGAAILMVLSATALASQGFVQDRRITMSQAQEMGKVAARGSEFPVVVNERVLKWLNYFLGTPEGRDRVRAALTRMEDYKSTIQKELGRYQMPEELMAIPLIESGYRNLEPIHNPVRAAGLWQFIASTAIHYGLRVDQNADERLNVEKETDAAMRLLLANKLRFSDWQLSILAYNSGENFVQGAIDRTGSRDAWALLQSGFGNEENQEYLPKFMAGILVMRNPSLVR